LTSAVEGAPLPLFLREQYSASLGIDAIRKKRSYLKQLASEIRRLHQCGFVHGDLIPSNILVRSSEDGMTFFYLDNDRTRRYPRWLPQPLWKRNLVQLNRFVLPGISLQDRMRFLRSYLGKKEWGERERRLVRWLEKRTRRRRRECDRVEAQVTFRELMRWNGPYV
jgi:serine/threonine protein kinase